MRAGIDMTPLRDAPGQVIFRVGAGVATFASWLALGAGGQALRTPGRAGVDGMADLVGLVAWFAAAAALAGLAGWRHDWIAAAAVYLGGIVGAAAVAWAAGVPEVVPGEPSAMRTAYHGMVMMVAAGMSAVLGALVVTAAYGLGRLLGRARGRP